MNHSLSNVNKCTHNFNGYRTLEFSLECFSFEFNNDLKFLLLTIIFLFIITLDILVNILVLLNIFFEKNKKRVDICFMSNAVSDLFMGIVIMPCTAIYTLFGHFPLGEYTCFIWNCLDFTVGTCSMLHIAYISYDRYSSVSEPLKYTHKVHDRFTITGIPTYLILTFIWFFSAAAWLPFVLYFKSDNTINSISDSNNETLQNDKRAIEYQCNIEATAFIVVPHSILVYYLPMFLILLFYSKTIFIVNEKMKRHYSNNLSSRITSTVSNSMPPLENHAKKGLQNVFKNQEQSKIREIWSIVAFCCFSILNYDSCGVCIPSQEFITERIQSNLNDKSAIKVII